MQCDVIIPVQDRLDLTRDCLESVYRHTHTPFNLIIIDNASAAKTKDFLKAFSSLQKNVVIIQNECNLGWVKAVNQGMRRATGPYLCIMNNDVIVRTDDWLSRLMEVAESGDDIGLVNPHFETKKKIETDQPFIEVDFCRGYCILIKRAVVERIGLLDESYGLGYYDDDDYSVRAIISGFRCVRANGVAVEHIGDATFSSIFNNEKRLALHERNKMLFYSKWGRRLKIVFIVTRDMDKKALSDTLFALARKQHIIFVWSFKDSFTFQHINIRQRSFPRAFHGTLFYLALCLNRMKAKESKRYDLVFVDSARLNSVLPKGTAGTYYADIEKDRNRIEKIVNSASKA